MTDGGPWRGPTTEEWVERIARGSTPVREYVDGRFVPWIDVTLRAPAMGSPTATVTPRAGAAGVELIAGSRRRSQVSPGD